MEGIGLVVIILIVLALIFVVLEMMGRVAPWTWGLCLVLIFIITHAGSFRTLH